ncbi:hypothetical protein [Pseudocolwellia agarivorans]|uniref:hypothetical protein n=1 Tax=Pseudocolwellia agarivorans TaxID=1911682 RepID=UPI0009849176|nr:hypothetical protein [Pseudocolwellia agarivorans]
MYSINDLNEINETLKPLKALAIREQQSIYGLSGMVYTPHIDAHNDICIKKAAILSDLKSKGLIAFTEAEIISAKLMALYRRTKNHQMVEYNGSTYECRFSPLKLSKSGKSVSKWAKYWLRKLPTGENDKTWESQVRETWPENFIIKNVDF